MDAQDYTARLHQLPCAACFMLLGKRNKAGIEVHHPEWVRDIYTLWLGIPLCVEHHRSKNGIHGLSRRGFENRYKLSEMDMVGCTIKLFNEASQ